MNDEKKLKVLLELYKVHIECIEKNKKNVLDTYRIYIPALFGLLIAISQIKEISRILESIGINIVYIIPAIEFFIIVSYTQVVYDLTDIICSGAYLYFLEQKINKTVSEKIALREEWFGESLRMINPENWKERLLRKMYIYIGPIAIPIAWVVMVAGIIGINLISIGYSLIMTLAIILFTWIIGCRRLEKAKNFVID